ncbi:DUF4371 domain-containing protein [Trichonephila clavipes]|nr:DUF4371 domain-containing protein [Trichonephila clavipes]
MSGLGTKRDRDKERKWEPGAEKKKQKEKYPTRFKVQLNIKPLSDIKWESRIETVKAALLQFDDVVEYIENLKNQTEQSDTLSDRDSVLNETFSFEFIVSLHVRYVNTISKLWLSVQAQLCFTLEHLRTICSQRVQNESIKEDRQTAFGKNAYLTLVGQTVKVAINL